MLTVFYWLPSICKIKSILPTKTYKALKETWSVNIWLNPVIPNLLLISMCLLCRVCVWFWSPPPKLLMFDSFSFSHLAQMPTLKKVFSFIASDILIIYILYHLLCRITLFCFALHGSYNCLHLSCLFHCPLFPVSSKVVISVSACTVSDISIALCVIP